MEKNKEFTTDRQRDDSRETVITDFLSEVFYPLLCKEGIIKSFRIEKNWFKQVWGVDAVLTLNDGTEITVDHKTRWSKTNVSNAAIPLELKTNYKDGSRHDGWFLRMSPYLPDKKRSKTQYILSIHLESAGDGTKDFKDINKDNINKVKFIFFKPDEVYEWLKKYEYHDLKSIVERAEEQFNKAVSPYLKSGEKIPQDIRVYDEGYFDKLKFVVRPRYGDPFVTYDGKISISAYRADVGDENPSSLVVKEFILKRFPSTRCFTYEKGSITEHLLNRNTEPNPFRP